MSRIIKSSAALTRGDNEKVITLKHIRPSITELSEEDLSGQQQLMYTEIEDLITEARNKADMIVSGALEERESILSHLQQEKDNWMTEREKQFQEAYEAGFQKGEEEGMKKGYQEYAQRLSEAERILEWNKQEYYSYLEKAQEVIVSLAIASAEKIIGKKIMDEPETFTSIVKRALKEVRQLPEVQIHCHPSRYFNLMENKEEIEAAFPANVQCFIYANDDLREEECYIETNQGRIIVSIDAQLAELKQKLFEMLQGDVT
ncbi:flagellar assembly protein FliH [Lysinibacillus sphaericus]